MVFKERSSRSSFHLVAAAGLLCLLSAALALCAELGAGSEDEQARTLLKKGRLLYESKKSKEAVELWQSIINRFPRSKVRFSVRLELGKHYLQQKNTEKAIAYLFRVIEDSTKNENEDEVAEAMFLTGKAHFDSGAYARAFTALREVTAGFPGTQWCNDSYYYIGMAHFRLKHYKRAIEAFQMVGTSISEKDSAAERIEGGRRLYIKLLDNDLLKSLGYDSVKVSVRANSGDREQVELTSVGLKGRLFVGNIPCELGKGVTGDGRLQTWGHDYVSIEYSDKQAAGMKSNIVRLHRIEVCGTAKLAFVDGALRKQIKGVVLDNVANVRLTDADRDTSAAADRVSVILRVKEMMEKATGPKSISEIEKEQNMGAESKPQFRVVKEVQLVLTEYDPALRPMMAGKGATAAAGPVHSGRFVGRVLVLRKPSDKEKKDESKALDSELPANTIALVCEKGQVLEIEYTDKLSVNSREPLTVRAEATVYPGSLRPLSVFDRQIKEQALKIRTELKTSEAIMEIGLIYKDLGLVRKANEKFDLALDHCKQILKEKISDRELVEQTQVMLWRIYFAKGDLEAASRMCITMLKHFPDSVYADEALLQMGKVAEGKKDFSKAISIYKRLMTVKSTAHHAEAQYRIALCYEEMSKPRKSGGEHNRPMYERALVEYKAVVDKHKRSKFAADAIMKIAEFYYNMKDYGRATEIYQKAIEEYPDGEFVDQILVNYGKSLLLMERYADAISKFDKLLTDYPQSKYVRVAKRYLELAQGKMGEQ